MHWLQWNSIIHLLIDLFLLVRTLFQVFNWWNFVVLVVIFAVVRIAQWSHPPTHPPLSQHFHQHNHSASIIWSSPWHPGICWRNRWAETFSLRETGNQTGLDCWLPDCRDWNHCGLLVIFGLAIVICSAGSYLDKVRRRRRSERRRLRGKWATTQPELVVTDEMQLSKESSLMDILEDIPQSSRIGKHPTFSQRPKTKMLDEGTDVELERRLVAVREPHSS